MQFNKLIKNLSFEAQINHYHEWAEVRLGDLYSMRNLHIQVNEMPTGSGPNQTEAVSATLSPAAFKKLEQSITEKLRKNFPVLMSTEKTGIAPPQPLEH